MRVAFVAPEKIMVEVQDNEKGISKENLKRVFNHGFTTKKNRHPFGRHSSVNAAREMGGGDLIVNSDGYGTGTSFTLTLPFISKES